MPKCLAFKHAVTIGVTGEVRPCCAWNAASSGVSITDDWESLHSKYYVESLRGWLPECIECKQDEESNGKSYRMYMNNVLADSIGTEQWDLKINNTCNLTCVSCDSYSSSSWAVKLVSAKQTLVGTKILSRYTHNYILQRFLNLQVVNHL